MRPAETTPIVLVAVDLRPGLDDYRRALRESASSVLASMPSARLACLNVMPASLLSVDENVDAAGDNVHVKRLALLRQFAEPLHLPRGKATYHLLEANSVDAGVIEFANANKVDHLIIGAHAAGGPAVGRRTAHIMSAVRCTVTVVRTAHAHGADHSEAN